MLDETIRTTVLELQAKGHSIRAIARILNHSRGSVRAVIQSGTPNVPTIEREEILKAWHEEILALYSSCKKNLVRVHEELLKRGVQISYQALTGYCRRYGVGYEPKLPAGHYHFEPGEEMQHDTSPHRVIIGGKERKAQCASLTFCFSRKLFFQYYPTFDRFLCKAFLTEAFRYFGGVCKRCVIDNTSVVVGHGTGKSMTPAPEMEAFETRFQFHFHAHELRDANRKARVERPFHYIEHNFLAGREFRDWDDLNQQARAWCEKVNSTIKRSLRASPIELFAREQRVLLSLPDYIPEIYRLHHRVVDNEGYVNVHSNRYSVPYKLMGRSLEIRESLHQIDVFGGPRKVASHTKSWDPTIARITLPEHRPPRGEGRSRKAASFEETELMKLEPRLANYIVGMKAHPPARITPALKRLLGMVHDFPREPLLKAVEEALAYGMFDLSRLEKMILLNVSQDYFLLTEESENDLESYGDIHER